MGSPKISETLLQQCYSRRFFDNCTAGFIDQAKDADAEIIIGGDYDKFRKAGWTNCYRKITNPNILQMETELFDL